MSQQTTPTRPRAKYDVPLIVGSLALIFALVALIALNPEGTGTVANNIFAKGTELFGPYTLLFAFLSLVLLIGLSFSKFGRIKLGQGEPEYKTFAWVAMMLAAGLGSATMVWAFVEWIYYYEAPPLGIQPESALAYEYALTYNFFHGALPHGACTASSRCRSPTTSTFGGIRV